MYDNSNSSNSIDTIDRIDSLDNIDTGGQSVTAMICEQARLHGATPERGEFDPREIWERDTAIGAVTEAFSVLADSIGMTGFQIADEAGSLLWGFVNIFDAQIRRLDKNIDRIAPELRDLQKSQDGTEIKSRELELLTDRARNLGARRDAFEEMRDAAAALYQAQTGEMWRPRSGSHTSRTGVITSAAIDARDFLRARDSAAVRENLPEGTLIAVAGGKDGDPDAVFRKLDAAHRKYADMVLVHGGGGSGVEKFAARWAEARGVHQVVCRPDWNAHGRAAPFRRNDAMLNLMPKGIILFPSDSGITANLADKATACGIPVHRC